MTKSSPAQSESVKKPLSQRIWLLLLFLPLLPPVSLILLWAGHPKLGKAVKLIFSLPILAVFVLWLGIIIASIANATGLVGRSLLDDPLRASVPAPQLQQVEGPAVQDDSNPAPTGDAAAVPEQSAGLDQENHIQIYEQYDPADGSIPTAPPEPEAQESLYIIDNDEYAPEFHYADCPRVQDIPEQDYLEVTSLRDDVVYRGFTPCRQCNP